MKEIIFPSAVGVNQNMAEKWKEGRPGKQIYTGKAAWLKNA